MVIIKPMHKKILIVVLIACGASISAPALELRPWHWSGKIQIGTALAATAALVTWYCWNIKPNTTRKRDGFPPKLNVTNVPPANVQPSAAQPNAPRKSYAPLSLGDCLGIRPTQQSISDSESGVGKAWRRVKTWLIEHLFWY